MEIFVPQSIYLHSGLMLTFELHLNQHCTVYIKINYYISGMCARESSSLSVNNMCPGICKLFSIVHCMFIKYI